MYKFITLFIALTFLSSAACRHVPNKKDRRVADSHLNLGTNHLNKGKYRKALSELLEAEKLDPDNARLQYALGLTYLQGFSRYEQARKHFAHAIKLKDKFSEALNMYGVSLMQESRYAEAIPYFEKALDNLLYGTPEFARQNLGWALYKSGRTDEGLRTLKQAVRNAPTLCGAYDWLAQAYQEQGEAKQAREWYQAFVDKCGSDSLGQFVGAERMAQVLYQLGLSYQKAGDLEHAKQQFATCVEKYAQTRRGPDCQKSLEVMPD